MSQRVTPAIVHTPQEFRDGGARIREACRRFETEQQERERLLEDLVRALLANRPWCTIQSTLVLTSPFSPYS